MTAAQYERWKDFTLRMAAHYPGITDARRKRLIDEIKDWFYWCEVDESWKHIISWDDSEEMPEKGRYGHTQWYSLCCDLFSEHFEEHNYHHKNPDREYKFHSQLSCCIRAGLDVAAEPSAGVLGFTIGDVKSFYDGEIPAWVNDAYDNKLFGADDREHIWL